jgi:hypothetical protein
VNRLHSTFQPTATPLNAGAAGQIGQNKGLINYEAGHLDRDNIAIIFHKDVRNMKVGRAIPQTEAKMYELSGPGETITVDDTTGP